VPFKDVKNILWYNIFKIDFYFDLVCVCVNKQFTAVYACWTPATTTNSGRKE